MDIPVNNPVAKHALAFNKAKVFVDRKKQLKSGATKHKKSILIIG